ncbi:MAG: hypothetical protein AAFZ15_17280 [Bacteroidota bacterium]
MTRIVEVAAINRSPSFKSELRQRAKNVKGRSLIDTSALSEGEMLLHIRVQRAKMLSEFYEGTALGEALFKEWKIGEDVLYKGLHTGFRSLTGVLENDTAGVFSAIRSGSGMTGRASKYFTWSEVKQSGGRTPNSKIGDPLIPLTDCNQLYPLIPVPPGQSEVTWIDFQGGRRDACNKENDWREMLNKDFEKSAHHPLYNFMTNPQFAKLEPIKQWKQGEHTKAINELSIHSTIKKSLLKEWQLNGVIRSNIREGAGPLNGIESINGLIQGKLNDDRAIVGIIEVAAIIAIVKAVGAALVAAAALVSAIKQKQPSAAQLFEKQIPNWADPSFNAEKDDFLTILLDENEDGTVSEQELSKILLPAGLLLGGVILMTGAKTAKNE